MSCIFCKIAQGEAPAHTIYEDGGFMAFLDIEPFAEGHALVIPKEHHQWIYDVPNFSGYWEVVKRVTEMMQTALEPKFVSYFTYGLDVPHAHVHVIPRESAAGGLIPPKKSVSQDELAKLAEKIKSAA